MTLAFFSLWDDVLRVNVNSQKRERRALALLRDRAGDCVGEVISREESPIDWDVLGDDDLELDDEAESSISPEIEHDVVHQALETHYRSWPDIALPALDGRTPREAARDRALRPRLVSLLKGMELRQSQAAWPLGTFDLSFLWEELGLKRP